VTPPPAAIYRETRERLGGFVVDLDDDRSRVEVPACPGWSVQDVVSHLVGIVADLQDGRMDGVGTDEWTRAQVTSRRAATIVDVVDEWNRRAPAFEEQVAGWPAGIASQLVADVAMHELDIRAAVGDLRARDSDGVALAFDYYAAKLGERIGEAGLPALVIDTATGTVAVGDGEPGATLRTSRFEVLRAMGGRRSAAQVLGYEWDGDAGRYLGVISNYGTRAEPLVE
jgi:uncharacterized protein (TIGR03083 family)